MYGIYSFLQRKPLIFKLRRKYGHITRNHSSILKQNWIVFTENKDSKPILDHTGKYEIDGATTKERAQTTHIHCHKSHHITTSKPDNRKSDPKNIQTAQAKHVKPYVILFLQEPTSNVSMRLFRLALRPFGSPADCFPCVTLPTPCNSLSFPRCFL